MKVAGPAPDFELKTSGGDVVRLSSYFGKKKIVLFFYVKDNTPGCASEIKGFKDYYANISDMYEILGINGGSE